MNKLFVPFLPPWVETGLQPAFYDKESGSVLQQTARMYNKVNCLIRNFNQLSKETKETVEEYIEKFTELKDFVDNYFDNLDVQEEINNKLDQMAEDGQLTDIIAQYLGLAGMITFNTVAEMKAAENLVDGSKCCTLGYHSVNDGGKSFYKVRTILNSDTVDEMNIIALHDNSLVAEFIVEDTISVKQFGAYGDATHDDTSIIQAVINKGVEVHIPDGTYMIDATATSISDTTAGLILPDDTVINMSKDATLKVIPNSVEWYDIFMLYNVNNITISGGNIVGDRDDHTYSGGGTHEWGAGIKCIGAKNVRLYDINITDCTGDGVDIGDFVHTDFNEDIEIRGCTIDNVRRNGISVENADNIRVINTNITNVNGTAPQLAIDLEPNNVANDKVTNILIDGCYIEGCTKGGVSCWRADNVKVVNSFISVPNETLPVSVLASPSTLEDNLNIIVSNNTFDSTGTGWYLIGTNCITSNNTFSNTNIYLTQSDALSIKNSIFSDNTVKDGLMKTSLGGGNYTVACTGVKIEGNTFSYTLSGENVNPTGSALDGLQYEIGDRQQGTGKKVSGIIIKDNIFEYLNTNIFTTPVNFINNKTSFDLGLINSVFKGNTLRNLPYGVVCADLQKVDIEGNRLEDVGFLWAYRAFAINNTTSYLVNFSHNSFSYTTSVPPSQCVYIKGKNHTVSNTLQATTAIKDAFLKLQDGSYSYAYLNFAVGANTNGCVSCYDNAGSIHASNNE